MMTTPRGTPRPMPIFADELKLEPFCVVPNSAEAGVVPVADAGDEVVVSAGKTVDGAVDVVMIVGAVVTVSLDVNFVGTVPSTAGIVVKEEK